MHFVRIMAEDTYDERIIAIQEDKLSRIERVLQDDHHPIEELEDVKLLAALLPPPIKPKENDAVRC